MSWVGDYAEQVSLTEWKITDAHGLLLHIERGMRLSFGVPADSPLCQVLRQLARDAYMRPDNLARRRKWRQEIRRASAERQTKRDSLPTGDE